MSDTMSYYLYKDVATGGGLLPWKVDKPMCFHEFCKRMGIQMCKYQTYHLKYPGDERMRGTTRLRRNRRGVKKRARADDEYGVAYE